MRREVRASATGHDGFKDNRITDVDLPNCSARGYLDLDTPYLGLECEMHACKGCVVLG